MKVEKVNSTELHSELIRLGVDERMIRPIMVAIEHVNQMIERLTYAVEDEISKEFSERDSDEQYTRMMRNS